MADAREVGLDPRRDESGVEQLDQGQPLIQVARRVGLGPFLKAGQPRGERLAPGVGEPIDLAKVGRRWIIEGSYWISYSLTTPPVISGVFYAMADIPNRL